MENSLWLETCTSTQDEIKKKIQEAPRIQYPHGYWVAADQQTQGRGRSGHEWLSFKGNLFLSVLLKPKTKEYLNWIPLTVAIALAELLEEKNAGLKIEIKWPNDLIFRNRKLGGILCEGQFSETGHLVIAGVGINLNHAPPAFQNRLKLNPISLKEAGFQSTEVKSFATLAARRITEAADYLDWRTSPHRTATDDVPKTNELRKKFEARSYFKFFDQIQWIENGQPETGHYLGIANGGELRVQKDSSEICDLLTVDTILKL